MAGFERPDRTTVKPTWRAAASAVTTPRDDLLQNSEILKKHEPVNSAVEGSTAWRDVDGSLDLQGNPSARGAAPRPAARGVRQSRDPNAPPSGNECSHNAAIVSQSDDGR